MNTELLAKLLRAISGAVERNDELALECALKAVSANTKPVKSKSNAKRSIEPKVMLSEADISKLVSECSDRVSATTLIGSYRLTRKELASLARFNSVHVTREDRQIDVLTKIVEALVGARLSSIAIRGDSLPHCTPNLTKSPPACNPHPVESPHAKPEKQRATAIAN